MPLATERVVQEALAREPAEGLGRSRYARREAASGYRKGDAEGTWKRADGVVRVTEHHGRGLEAPSRSPGWTTLAKTSARLKTLRVELCGGGMAPRDIAAALAQARGPCVRSTSTSSTMTDPRSQASDACRPRDRRGHAGASRFIATVYAPFRRWGSKTGVWWVGGIAGDGRQVLLPRSTVHSESLASWRNVRRARTLRGRQTPSTLTTDGTPGRRTAVAGV